MPRAMNEIMDYVRRMDAYGPTLRSEPVPLTLEELATVHEVYFSSVVMGNVGSKGFSLWAGSGLPVTKSVAEFVLGHPMELI